MTKTHPLFDKNTVTVLLLVVKMAAHLMYFLHQVKQRFDENGYILVRGLFSGQVSQITRNVFACRGEGNGFDVRPKPRHS